MQTLNEDVLEQILVLSPYSGDSVLYEKEDLKNIIREIYSKNEFWKRRLEHYTDTIFDFDSDNWFRLYSKL